MNGRLGCRGRVIADTCMRLDAGGKMRGVQEQAMNMVHMFAMLKYNGRKVG